MSTSPISFSSILTTLYIVIYLITCMVVSESHIITLLFVRIFGVLLLVIGLNFSGSFQFLFFLFVSSLIRNEYGISDWGIPLLFLIMVTYFYIIYRLSIGLLGMGLKKNSIDISNGGNITKILWNYVLLFFTHKKYYKIIKFIESKDSDIKGYNNGIIFLASIISILIMFWSIRYFI